MDYNIAYSSHEGTAAKSIAGADQVNILVEENTSRADYDDFSSLKSRVPRLELNSAGGLRNPVTTSTSIGVYENVALEVMAVAEDAASDAKQENTQVDGDTAQYEEFSSLRSRLASQKRSSAETFISTEAYNAHDRIAGHEENVTHALEDNNQQKIDGTTNPTGYDDFSSLRLRLVEQIRSSFEGVENPITPEGTDKDMVLAEEMVAIGNVAHNPVIADYASICTRV